ncbi:receptor-like protein EIX2 [Curcuma longa]|uniref:receptor-like protein EIX2 n=1 Tax=Curcuma longa TaxID=136217 RepID=UPI003D9F75BD
MSLWQGQDCCSWPGVTCRNATGRVVALDLHGWELQATGWRTISSSLLALTQLRRLDLAGNDFSIARFPELSFRKLRYLDLSFTAFSGGRLDPLANLSSLHYVDLTESLSPGSYRIDHLRWLSGLPDLTHLDLSGLDLANVSDWFSPVNSLNRLEALYMEECNLSTIPISSATVNLSSLAVLDLYNNSIAAGLPDWLWNLTSLVYLDLSESGFAGPVPEAVGDLTSLESLDLRYNSLNGSIPSSISKLTSLVELFLHANDFGGVVSEAHFSNLTNLEYLWLSWNDRLSVSLRRSWVAPFRLTEVGLGGVRVGPQFPAWLKSQAGIRRLDLWGSGIEGPLPEWLWHNVSSGVNISVDLSGNRITGELPASLEFTKLTELSLGNNLLEGPLPTELPASLGSLYLDNNSFSGHLPPLPYLKELSLSDNELEGSISSLCRSTSLQLLVLSNNKFTGAIPYCLGESSRGLRALNLGNNGFSGEIPSSIRFLTELSDLELSNNGVSGEPLLLLENCSMLSYVELAENRFTGSIPHWIGDNLPGLIYLRLRSNKFSGQIPTQLAKLESLQILDLASNNFSGFIPTNIGNLRAMASSQATIFLPDPIDLHVYSKGQDMYYGRSLDLVNSLDLSSNSLAGDIPEGIGDLASLGNLNLSRNRLTGKIPSSIGGLASLESLDLSMNLLSGNIPRSLSSLTFLSYLNLSCNNLSGEIPSGHQLQTLEDPSIYMNNPHLCGPPISKSCSSNVTVMESGEKEYHKDDSDLVGQCISIILGFVMGFWIFCGVIFFKDGWRHAYFRNIDKFFDRIFRQ